MHKVQIKIPRVLPFSNTEIMNGIINTKNKLISTLVSESQKAIKEANEYVSCFSPNIFGRQPARDSDEENYFKLYRSVSSVSDSFSSVAVSLSQLEERAKELYARNPLSEIEKLITSLHECARICSLVEEQCFSPYLNGIYKVLGLDFDSRADINVGAIRNLTHGFSVNLKEFINNLEIKK